MKTNQEHVASRLVMRPLVAAVAFAVASISHAEGQAKQDDVALEKVVVTANKRAQNLQDVPAAITVLTDETLQRTNLKDIDDLPALAPALTVTYSNQPGNYSLNMRGIGTFSLGVGVESDVSVIIDDVPVAMQAGAFKDMADVFRIEVLKGPQSTLFGKSAIAGALNITTKPLGGPLKTTVSTLATNDHEWRVGASVSGSLSDTVRMRIAGSATDYDGNVHNLTTGKNVNGSKGQSLVTKFEWAPTDDLTIQFSPSYNKTEKFCCQSPFTYMTPGGLYQNVKQLPASELLAGIPIGPGNTTVRGDFPIGGKFWNAGAGLRAAYVFPSESRLAGHTLTSITSYNRYHMDDYNDGDSTDSDVLQYLKGTDGKLTGLHGGLYQQGFFNTRSKSEEVRWTSPDSGALRYVVGLWYGKNDLERMLRRAPATSFANAYLAQAYNDSRAIFGQSTWDFLPSTSLLTGLRFNREITGYKFYRYAAPPAAQVVTESFSGRDAKNDITGKVGLEHRWNKDLMTYALMSTGHKGVAYDLTSSFNADVAKTQPVPAETARNFEVGAKTVLWNNRAMVNVALFKTNFKGFQQSAGFTDSDGVFRTTLHSIGELQTRGIEIDGGVRLSREFTLNGSFAYTDATVVEFENGPCYTVRNAAGTATVPGPGCVKNPKYNNTNVQDLAGKTLPNAPKYKLNLNGQYEFDLANAGLSAFVAGAWRYQSATQFSLNQNPGTIQPGYGIFNLSAGVKDKKDRYKFSLFVNNVFNKPYATILQQNAGNGGWASSAPNPTVLVSTSNWTPARDAARYFGARLDVKF